MYILPAIDLKGGQCVRLRQGRMDDATTYSTDPVKTALYWQSLGAEFLHLVDLDGAFAGEPRHTEIIGKIAKAISIPFEVGGGLRSDEHVRQIIDAGASRAIIGTRAISEPTAIQSLVDKYGSKIAVGIDARDGFVQVNGWVETTSVCAIKLAKKMSEIGMKTIIYTDTATDGMLKGVNLKAMAEMADAVPDVSLIASGGVTEPADVLKLAKLKRKNLDGVIIGKALYEKTAALPDFLNAAKSEMNFELPR